MSDDPARHPVTELTLVIPPANDHIRFARLMASAVAARLGYDFDTLENLRIAVSELCTAVTEGAVSRELTLTYRGDVEGLRITGYAPAVPGSPAPREPEELTRQILDAVADEHSFDIGPSGINFTLLLRATLPLAP